jgi:hypothetical protein
LLKFFSEYGVLILCDRGGGAGGARRVMEREWEREREREGERGPDSWIPHVCRGESQNKNAKRHCKCCSVLHTTHTHIHTHTHTHTHTHKRATYTYSIHSEAIMPNPKVAMCQSKP